MLKRKKENKKKIENNPQIIPIFIGPIGLITTEINKEFEKNKKD